MIDLLTRKSDGIEVIVWFDKDSDGLYLEVKDQRGHEEFMVPIPSDEAMEAFNHPFTYRTPCYVPTIGDLPNDGALA